MLDTDRAMEQATGSAETARGAALDKSPRFWTSTRPFGFMVAARRHANEDEYYWRLTPFMLPSYTIIPGGDQPDRNLGGHVWVPMDDEHVWTFSFTWNTERALTDDERSGHQEGLGIHTQVDKNISDWNLGLSNAYLPVRNRFNNYQIDRDEQRDRTFTGIRGISEQDMSIQEAMGRKSPRWLEHLGTTDKAIIEFRALLLRMCKDLMNGKEPEQPHNPAVYEVRSAAFNLPHDVPWEEGMVPFVQARA
jgi:phthalate 4,5-dioxygenase oxygenase subunit